MSTFLAFMRIKYISGSGLRWSLKMYFSMRDKTRQTNAMVYKSIKPVIFKTILKYMFIFLLMNFHGYF